MALERRKICNEIRMHPTNFQILTMLENETVRVLTGKTVRILIGNYLGINNIEKNTLWKYTSEPFELRRLLKINCLYRDEK